MIPVALPTPHAGGRCGSPYSSPRWSACSRSSAWACYGPVAFPALWAPSGTKSEDRQQVANERNAATKRSRCPQVNGLEKQAARSRLAEAGFRVAVRPRESSREDTDRVLEQSVAGGKEAREGSRIVLIVGGGPSVAEVPDLVGLTYSEAVSKLEQAGYLLGGVKEIRSATVPAGVIAEQDPRAGTPLDQGSYVYLTTSVGPP